MSCDAVLTGTQDSVHAIMTIDGGAPRSGIALVTGLRSIPKVITASTLKEIAACGGHIAELRRRARKQRLREHRIDLLNDRVVGKITIANLAPIRTPPSGSFSTLSSGSALMSSRVVGCSTLS